MSISIRAVRMWRLLTPVLLSCTLLLAACIDEENPTITSGPSVTQYVAANNLTLLNAALTRAGATTLLSGAGPFTLFAPTDDAFRAAGYLDAAAINAVPLERLQQLMQYHVVRASLPTSAIPAGLSAYVTSLTTASSDSRIYLNKNTSDGIISVNGSRILTADASASNGLVHTIDQVLTPPLGNVLRLMQADTSLSLLVTAIQQGGAAVTEPLSGTTALTVFAPTNAALRAAGYGSQAAIQAIPTATLAGLLTNHVVANARTYTQSLTNGATLTSAGGGSLTVTVGTGTAVSITSRGNSGTAARVLDNTVVGNTLVQNRNATAINGVLHKIDRVLLP